MEGGIWLEGKYHDQSCKCNACVIIREQQVILIRFRKAIRQTEQTIRNIGDNLPLNSDFRQIALNESENLKEILRGTPYPPEVKK